MNTVVKCLCQLTVVDTIIVMYQFAGFITDHWIFRSYVFCLCTVSCCRSGKLPRTLPNGFFRHIFEKEIKFNIEYLRQISHAAGANTVHTFFVFLNLLKSKPEEFGQFFL